MPADFAVTELWQVLGGHLPGRRHADEITVIDSVGFALEDYAALTFVADAARALGIGETIEPVPRTTDPKNLYGLLRDDLGEDSRFDRRVERTNSTSSLHDAACHHPRAIA